MVPAPTRYSNRYGTHLSGQNFGPACGRLQNGQDGRKPSSGLVSPLGRRLAGCGLNSPDGWARTCRTGVELALARRVGSNSPAKTARPPFSVRGPPMIASFGNFALAIRAKFPKLAIMVGVVSPGGRSRSPGQHQDHAV